MCPFFTYLRSLTDCVTLHYIIQCFHNWAVGNKIQVMHEAVEEVGTWRGKCGNW